MAIAEIITASGIALGTLGGGVAFVWNKVEQRFKHIEAQLLECQKRETESHERRGALVDRRLAPGLRSTTEHAFGITSVQKLSSSRALTRHDRSIGTPHSGRLGR